MRRRRPKILYYADLHTETTDPGVGLSLEVKDFLEKYVEKDPIVVRAMDLILFGATTWDDAVEMTGTSKSAIAECFRALREEVGE